MKQRKERMAVKIQAVWRGHHARVSIVAPLRETMSALAEWRDIAREITLVEDKLAIRYGREQHRHELKASPSSSTFLSYSAEAEAALTAATAPTAISYFGLGSSSAAALGTVVLPPVNMQRKRQQQRLGAEPTLLEFQLQAQKRRDMTDPMWRQHYYSFLKSKTAFFVEHEKLPVVSKMGFDDG
jgi:hypothetical protein